MWSCLINPPNKPPTLKMGSRTSSKEGNYARNCESSQLHVAGEGMDLRGENISATFINQYKS